MARIWPSTTTERVTYATARLVPGRPLDRRYRVFVGEPGAEREAGYVESQRASAGAYPLWYRWCQGGHEMGAIVAYPTRGAAIEALVESFLLREAAER